MKHYNSILNNGCYFFILKTIKFVYGKPILGFYFFRIVVGGGDMQEAKNTNAHTSLFNIHVV